MNVGVALKCCTCWKQETILGFFSALCCWCVDGSNRLAMAGMSRSSAENDKDAHPVVPKTHRDTGETPRVGCREMHRRVGGA